MSENEEPLAEEVIRVFDTSDMLGWRVINRMAVGQLTGTSFEDDEEPEIPDFMLAMIQLETVDVDGSNPMDVVFGLNPGAMESLLGSLCLNRTSNEQEAKALYDLIWGLLMAAGDDDD